MQIHLCILLLASATTTLKLGSDKEKVYDPEKYEAALNQEQQ